MNKIVNIIKKVISYIGAICLGIFFMAGLQYGFTAWINAGLILAALLMVCAFVGGQECIPEDEREEE